MEELAAEGIVTTPPDRVFPDSDQHKVVPMLENSGIFTGNTNASDDQLFICERKTFSRLCTSLSQPCPCQSYSRKPTTFRQKGHVLRIEFQCDNCGTKNVAKKMTKLAVGTKKTQGKTWFPELSDKRKSTKVHLYYCMKNCKNCAQSAEKLRKSILNISKHYQNKHDDCEESSFCKCPGYRPTKILLKDPAAIEAYEMTLKETLIYKSAESYCRCRDTYWVESFNHQLLT
ncbi:uncharacterized protein LOC135344697 [Halichondria panicea]|uniref:uncharacterized protein LOC135344697 n=1 Tax=Halichondria panicea TaxID=6063 RepID=UPI00312B6F8C